MTRIITEERRQYMKAYLKEYAKSPEQREKRREYRRNIYNTNTQQQYHIKCINKNPIAQLVRVAKHRAKKNGVEFNLAKEDVTWNTICPILGIELVFNIGQGSGGKDNSPSLDRIDNTKGYIKGNVQVISHKANSMKFTANKEELIKFAEWIRSTYV